MQRVYSPSRHADAKEKEHEPHASQPKVVHQHDGRHGRRRRARPRRMLEQQADLFGKLGNCFPVALIVNVAVSLSTPAPEQEVTTVFDSLQAGKDAN